jgi:hypothetical protein
MLLEAPGVSRLVFEHSFLHNMDYTGLVLKTETSALMKYNQCAFDTPGLCPDHPHTSDALVCILVEQGEKLLMSG